MASLNKVHLIGRLGGNPEMKKTSGGKTVAHLRVATSTSFTDNKGKKEEHTDWHRVVVWNRLAESCEQYLKKGSQVYVEGKNTLVTYVDESGNKKFFTQVDAKNIQFLDPKPKS